MPKPDLLDAVAERAQDALPVHDYEDGPVCYFCDLQWDPKTSAISHEPDCRALPAILAALAPLRGMVDGAARMARGLDNRVPTEYADGSKDVTDAFRQACAELGVTE